METCLNLASLYHSSSKYLFFVFLNFFQDSKNKSQSLSERDEKEISYVNRMKRFSSGKYLLKRFFLLSVGQLTYSCLFLLLISSSSISINIDIIIFINNFDVTFLIGCRAIEKTSKKYASNVTEWLHWNVWLSGCSLPAHIILRKH